MFQFQKSSDESSTPIETKKIETACARCGKPIVGRRIDARFCCAICCTRFHKRLQRKNHAPINCATCGTSFVPINCTQVCCSLRCQRKHHYNKDPQKHRQNALKYMRADPQHNAKVRTRYLANKDKWHAYSNQRRRKIRILQPWRQPLDSARHRAKSRNREFNLTEEWCLARWTGKCEVCQLPFVIGPAGAPGPRMFAPSIDRINPACGYTQDNCRFVLMAVNSLKHNGTDMDMYRIAAAMLAAKGFKLLAP